MKTKVEKMTEALCAAFIEDGTTEMSTKELAARTGLSPAAVTKAAEWHFANTNGWTDIVPCLTEIPVRSTNYRHIILSHRMVPAYTLTRGYLRKVICDLQGGD